MDFDYEEPIEKRFEDLCQDLCIEGSIREEAWEKYKDVWANFSIDGDQLQWLVCSLYECCRRSITDGLSSHLVENAYVSLSRLLAAAKMSMVQFFHRIRKWADMTDMVDDMRDRVELIERQFAVSSVIFRNFGRSFSMRFCEPQDHMQPTGVDLFRFTWLLFIKSRASFPAVTDDLVNSYHLLACCLDWVLGCVMVSRRSDLIQLVQTDGFPKDFLAAVSHKKVWCPPPRGEAPCMLRMICEDNGVDYVECKTVKEHFFRPLLSRLIDKDVVKLDPLSYGSLLEPENFELTLQNLNNNYEEYIIATGDFDERIYLSPNAAEEIGSASQSGVQSTLGLSTDLAPSFRSHMLELNTTGFGGFTETTRIGDPSAGLIGRLNGGISFSNAEARNQNLTQLQILLTGRSKEPSPAFSDMVQSHCSTSPMNLIKQHLAQFIDQFHTAYCNSIGAMQHCSAVVTVARQRSNLCTVLYNLVLECLVSEEIRKAERRINISLSTSADTGASQKHVKPDLSALLSQEIFHRSLFACCMELVLICCDPPERHFPWILDALQLEAFYFCKVIEVTVRSLDFSRDVAKYMKQVSEIILDSFAWRSTSVLWQVLKNAGRAPSIDEVISPERLEQSGCLSNFNNSDGFGSESRKLTIMSPSSNLIIKPSSSSTASTKPRLLTSMSGTAATGVRVRSNLPAHHPLFNEDESARAAAQLLASGEEHVETGRSDASLLHATTEETTTASTDAILAATGTTRTGVENPSDGGQSLWLAASNALLNYYRARHDSLAIFFRHFYLVASLRLRDLCERLHIPRELMIKMWTCFEHVTVYETDLFRDRCLDQILLCCLYAVSKVALYRPLGFIDIIQAYRMQPQAHRDNYRHVLIVRVHDRPDIVDDRGDITQFYNLVFVPLMFDFVRKVVPTSTTSVRGPGSAGLNLTNPSCGDPSSSWIGGQPTLAAMPLPPGASGTDIASGLPGTINTAAHTGGPDGTPSKRLTTNRNVFISPVKQPPVVNLSPKRVVYTVGRSHGKELQDVNLMISSAERRASMANLTMGLKRTSSSLISGSSGSGNVPGITSGGSRTVTLSGFSTKRLDFDM